MSKQRTRSVLRGSDAVVKDAPFTIHVEQSNLRANNKCAVKSNNREARVRFENFENKLAH